MSDEVQEEPIREDLLRSHVYDGIQEYDQKLPNWWLFTLYGAIIFSIGYWIVLHHTEDAEKRYAYIKSEMARIEAVQLASSGNLRDNEVLWNMSRNSDVVANGRSVYMTNCASCHGKKLEGGIGLKLADAEWKHGGEPVEIFETVESGVLEKGMPSWGPVLGPNKVATAVAFVLSHHQKP